jgi:2-oxoisovalerate ferredoxin oxidoreductase alpha subunit
VSTKKVITGNYTASYGALLCRAEVVPAYPITPQTSIVEKIAEFVATGEMKAQYIKVESEHTAMAACISAALTGARTFTATSAHGLVLMHEMLHWAAGARTPVVMANVNRALAPPWSVWADHTDSMSQRDTGWIQFYASSNQEVLDTMIMCYRVCEQPDIMLPAMVNMDAFILSHTSEVVDVPDISEVDGFLPQFNPEQKLDVDAPKSFGTLAFPHSWYMEWRYKIQHAHDMAAKRFVEEAKAFEEHFGRPWSGILEEYRSQDAEHILVTMSTIASTAKDVVDDLRNEGRKVGLVRPICFRPFPTTRIREVLGHAKAVGVADRSHTFGNEGPLFTEIKGALYNAERKPPLAGFTVGIGGRDVLDSTIRGLFDRIETVAAEGVTKEVAWIDLTGDEEEVV